MVRRWWNTLWHTSGDGGFEHSKIELEPGEVEEAVSLFASPGKIDLSDLQFYAVPYRKQKDLKNMNLLPDHTIVDVAVFPLPSTCDPRGRCDITKVGVGHKRSVGDHGYGSAFTNLCDDKTGRLIIEPDYFVGHHFSLYVPRTGEMDRTIAYSLPAYSAATGNKIDIHNAGVNYEVVIANCNGNGRMVKIKGDILFDYDENHFLGGKDPVYPLISAVVFLICCCRFIRIQCHGSPPTHPTTHQTIPLNDDYDSDGDEEDESSSEMDSSLELVEAQIT